MKGASRTLLRRACAVGALSATVAAATLAVGLLVAPPAGAAERAGEATIVHPRDGSPTSGTPLAGGTGATAFSLRLPDGAACSGDSATGGYRVQSFIVPSSVDPATLIYGIAGPLPAGKGANLRQPLRDRSSRAFVNAATDLATTPGGPGPVINLPAFDLRELDGADLPSGAYVVGIACTRGEPSAVQLDRYWTAPFRVGEAPPGGTPEWVAPNTPASPATPVPSAGTATPSADAVVSPVPEGSAGSAAGGPAQPTASDAAAAAASADASSVASDADTPAEVAGGTPSFRPPVIDVVEQLSLDAPPAAALAGWTLLALAFGRAAVLLRRTPTIHDLEPA